MAPRRRPPPRATKRRPRSTTSSCSTWRVKATRIDLSFSRRGNSLAKAGGGSGWSDRAGRALRSFVFGDEVVELAEANDRGVAPKRGRQQHLSLDVALDVDGQPGFVHAIQAPEIRICEPMGAAFEQHLHCARTGLCPWVVRHFNQELRHVRSVRWVPKPRQAECPRFSASRIGRNRTSSRSLRERWNDQAPRRRPVVLDDAAEESRGV